MFYWKQYIQKCSILDNNKWLKKINECLHPLPHTTPGTIMEQNGTFDRTPRASFLFSEVVVVMILTSVYFLQPQLYINWYVFVNDIYTIINSRAVFSCCLFSLGGEVGRGLCISKGYKFQRNGLLNNICLFLKFLIQNMVFRYKNAHIFVLNWTFYGKIGLPLPRFGLTKDYDSMT